MAPGLGSGLGGPGLLTSGLGGPGLLTSGLGGPGLLTSGLGARLGTCMSERRVRVTKTAFGCQNWFILPGLLQIQNKCHNETLNFSEGHEFIASISNQSEQIKLPWHALNDNRLQIIKRLQKLPTVYANGQVTRPASSSPSFSLMSLTPNPYFGHPVESPPNIPSINDGMVIFFSMKTQFTRVFRENGGQYQNISQTTFHCKNMPNLPQIAIRMIDFSRISWSKIQKGTTSLLHAKLIFNFLYPS